MAVQRKFLAVLCLIGLMAAPLAAQQRRGRAARAGGPGNAAPSQSQTMRTMVNGQMRTAHFYAGNSRNQHVPLVFVFHGHGQSGEIANRLFQLEDAWPGAFVIYPDGIPGIVADDDPSGRKPGWQKDPGEANDRDLKFFDEMYNLITTSYMIDTTQVYSVGFSNGARMTYLLWSQRRSSLAATAAFSSQALTADLYTKMAPLPSMVGHGVNDPNFPYNQAVASFNKVAQVNKVVVDKTGRSARDIGIFPYQPGPGGAETVQWTHNGGHEPPRNPGPEIVRFLKRHHQ